MQIHQFSVRYIPEEDRLLLRLNTLDRKEFRFFLTRRYVRLLWPVLERLLHSEQNNRHPAQAPSAADAIMAFEQERALSAANFKKKFEETPAEFPLGERPVLLSRIQVAKKQGKEMLSLMPGTGRGIELPAHPRMLHTLRRTIQEAAGRAQWDLFMADSRSQPAESRALH